MTREELKTEGINILKQFCELNNMEMPKIVFSDKPRRECDCCGYYEHGTLTIMPNACSSPATNPIRSWSYPHYFVDKTVLGVICHEFGHYLYELAGRPRFGKLGLQITSYEPNMDERFAETIKIFLTNPDLLKQYNRERYDFLTVKLKLKPVYTADWKTQLNIYGAVNEKYVNACLNRIKRSTKN